MKLALIQMSISGDSRENLCRAGDYIARAAELGADMAVLPEMFCCPYNTALFREYSEPEGGERSLLMAEIANKNKIWLVAGSVPESAANGKVYNTLYLYGRDGTLAAKHRKAHLFDIDIENGQSFKESEVLSCGNGLTTAETEFGTLGLAVCYDIRFPELFSQMAARGARLIIVPAAFNMTTGPAHWELTFRARALDNQAFVVGVAAARDNNAHYISYAHSIITSPWGEVLTQMDEKEGMIVYEIDLGEADRIRKQLPLLEHRRPDIYK